MTLQGGDIAFFGNGPDDTPWFVGIEHKQIGDIVSCIKSGRFAGTQLPEMLKLYDVCFLLVEGGYQPDYDNITETGEPRLWVPYSKGYGNRFGLAYRSFDNYLSSLQVFTSLQGKPCIVKCAKNRKESVQIIRDLYLFFQKRWEDHRSMSAQDHTKMVLVQREMDLVRVGPDDATYPKQILRKALFQVDGIGWDVAGAIANQFGVTENALKATQKDLELIDRVGPRLAKRIFRALHGYDDPTVKVKRIKTVT